MSSVDDEKYIEHSRNKVEDDIGKLIETKLRFLDSDQFTEDLLRKKKGDKIRGILQKGVHYGAKSDIGINYGGRVLPFNHRLNNKYRVILSGSSSGSPETSLGGRRRTSKRKTYKKHNRSKRIHKFRT